VSYAIDNPVPIPLPLTWINDEAFRSANITLTDNYIFGRFTLGYGINYAIYTWKLDNEDYNFPPSIPEEDIRPEDLRPSLKKNSHGFGFGLKIHNQFTKWLSAGIVYNPPFVNTFPETEWKYQHVLSLECVYKLKL